MTTTEQARWDAREDWADLAARVRGLTEEAQRTGEPHGMPPRRRHTSREQWRWYQDMTFATRYGNGSRYQYSLTLFGKAYDVWKRAGEKPVLLLASPFYVNEEA